MLFNSHVFILAFLPVTVIGFFILGGWRSSVPARIWLLAASLVFYGWWSLTYLGLLLIMILSNYLLGLAIRWARSRDDGLSRRIMLFGVVVNLAPLAYFKYANFVAQNVWALTGMDFAIGAVILPLAISFYTFQQIAYLVDVHRGEAEEYSLLDYALFVSFFPQLIAGPIIHHREIVPVMQRAQTYHFQDDAFAAGIAFFIIGLLKKLAIADPVGALATPTFAGGGDPGFLEAWLAVSAFTIGLYFDFSGYSDMAVGLARMFGISLPYNFNSPYKATSIIDFWRRWHMTLSRFLRDYVYIPLGGNRRGATRRHVNLMLTMLLGGIWHGAGWTFVIWGGLHGFYLLVNHAWSGYVARAAALGRNIAMPPLIAHGLTLLAVMVAWTLFAAPSLDSAISVLGGMSGANGLGPRPPVLGTLVDVTLGRRAIEFEGEAGVLALLERSSALAALLLGWILVLFAPNSQEIVDGRRERVTEMRRWARIRFHPTAATAVAAAAAFLFALTLMAEVKEFVYFQF